MVSVRPIQFLCLWGLFRAHQLQFLPSIIVMFHNCFAGQPTYEKHTFGFQTFFVSALLLIVHTWNSSPLRSNLLRLQCICCTVPTTSGRPHGSLLVETCQGPSSQPLSSSPQLSHNESLWAYGITKSHRELGLDYREGDELWWCPFWSISLWQGCSYGLVHCPGRNATDPIWRVLASSEGISSWTPSKPQHSNPNPDPNTHALANQLWCIDFLILSHLSSSLTLPAFLESLMPLKNWCSIHARFSKTVWSIPYVSVEFFPFLKQNFIAYNSKVSGCIFEIHQL